MVVPVIVSPEMFWNSPETPEIKFEVNVSDVMPLATTKSCQINFENYR
jgi:hypothetical protein